MTINALFEPVAVGGLSLKHRVVLAPLTRVRADAETAVPSDLAVEYYAQRASDGGLLITEATFISAEARGMLGTPGLYSPAQIAQWRRITDAVHAKGGAIFAQLWALGVAKTVLDPVAETYNSVPVTAMTEADMDRVVGAFAQAARNAIEAGFDGVEVHGANGYALTPQLIDQFLQSGTNTRTDAFGGALENRLRFPHRVLDAVVAAVGARRVGLRMSPFSTFQDMGEAHPLATFVPWARAALRAPLAYLHIVGPRDTDDTDVHEAPDADAGSDRDLAPLRAVANAAGVPLIVAGGATPASARKDAAHGDLVAFGRAFIARIQHGWELNAYDRSTFYTPGPKGYVDYPTYSAA